MAVLPGALRAQQPRGPTSPAAPPARPGAQIAALPAIVHLNVDGAEQATAVEIRNEGKAPAQLRYYLGDFEQNENGDFSFIPFGKGEHSCGSRLTAFPDGTVLAPGEQQQVQLHLAPGAGVCWAMLFVESLPEGTSGFRIIQRIGVRVTNAPPGTPTDGEVGAVTVRRLKGDTLSVLTVFQNTGRAPVDLRGRVEVRDYAGHTLSQTEFGPLNSLPGRPRAVQVFVPIHLARGDYLAVPIVDFGGDYLAGGQATFSVP